MQDKSYWVYILYCDNNTYYTGYTNNLIKRFNAHVAGTAKCRYTQSFKPRYIAQSWEIKGPKALAMRIEREIKKLSRTQKEYLIHEPSALNILDVKANLWMPVL